jgi:hypothetical protein
MEDFFKIDNGQQKQQKILQLLLYYIKKSPQTFFFLQRILDYILHLNIQAKAHFYSNFNLHKICHVLHEVLHYTFFKRSILKSLIFAFSCQRPCSILSKG